MTAERLIKSAVIEAIRHGKPVRIDPDGTVHINEDQKQDDRFDYDTMDMRR